MSRHRLMSWVAAMILAAFAAAFSAPVRAQPQGGYGPGMMGGYGYGSGDDGYGPGMMGGYGYGRGYMGPWMMGPGWGGPGWGPGQTDLALSVDDVKTFFTRWLASQGNPHLTLGDVKEKDADTITVDVVTKDNKGLVQRYVVNRHNGFFRPEAG